MLCSLIECNSTKSLSFFVLSRRKCGGLIVWHFSINRTKNQGGKYTYKDIPSILHVVRVARGFIRFCFFFFSYPALARMSAEWKGLALFADAVVVHKSLP